jgi:hypothetical protein
MKGMSFLVPGGVPMDKRRAEELADRVRQHEQHVAALERKGAAVIGRSRQAVARSREAREFAASVFVRTIAMWRAPLEVEFQGSARQPRVRPEQHVPCELRRADDASASRHEGTAMAYYANFGPLSGPLLSSAGYFAIEVLQVCEVRIPIGMALVTGQDRDGRALWRLTIDTIELPELFVVIDRQFRPAQ